MGILNRLGQIAKSYANSAGDTITNEFEDLYREWESGNLSDALRKRASKLKQSAPKTDDPDYEDIDSSYSEEAKTGANRSKGNRQNQLVKAYERLGLQPGATVAEAEKAYKRLMREFHPDRFATSDEKQKVATQVSQMLSQAIEEIRRSGAR